MIVAEKIRQARELNRMTQADLAEKIGVHQSTLAQMEIGVYDPREHIQKIGFATGFPAAFFDDPEYEDFAIGTLQYRSRASLLRKSDKEQAHRYAQTLFQLHQHLARKLRRPAPCAPRLDKESPRRAAEITRTVMGLSPNVPIPNVTNSVEKLGVAVLGLPIALTNTDAFSVVVGEIPVIALSAGLPGDRIRFSVAHELAHLVLHRTPTGSIRSMERQADEFAADLLLPYEAMLEELPEGAFLAVFAKLKPRWKVSIQTLARRARDMNRITDRQYKAVFEQLARMGFSRNREPENLNVPVEKPRALRQMAEKVYGVPVDYQRFGRQAKLTPSFLKAVMEAHSAGPQKDNHPKGANVLRIR